MDVGRAIGRLDDFISRVRWVEGSTSCVESVQTIINKSQTDDLGTRVAPRTLARGDGLYAPFHIKKGERVYNMRRRHTDHSLSVDSHDSWIHQANISRPTKSVASHGMGRVTTSRPRCSRAHFRDAVRCGDSGETIRRLKFDSKRQEACGDSVHISAVPH